MRKYFILIVILIVLMSCKEGVTYSAGKYEYVVPERVEMPVVEHPLDIIPWIEENMTYKFDTKIIGDDWQAPHESVELLTGDCEDVIILLMSYFVEFGMEEGIYFIGIKDTNDSASNHALLEVSSTSWINFGSPAGVGTSFMAYDISPSLIDKMDNFEVILRLSWEEVLHKMILGW
jgi:hypothetical protein